MDESVMMHNSLSTKIQQTTTDQQQHTDSQHLMDDDGHEKFDCDPENLKKSCDVSPDDVNDISFDESCCGTDIPFVDDVVGNCDKLVCDKAENVNEQTIAPTSTSIQKIIDTGKSMESSKALAFTIDFNDGKQVDSKKFNDIVERFQKRHKRGVSLSKLDDQISLMTTSVHSNASTTSASKNKPPIKKHINVLKQQNDQYVGGDEFGVTFRDKSRLSKQDEHRHSWSSRSSIHLSKNLANDLIHIEKPINFQPKSTTLQMTFHNVKGNTLNSFQLSDSGDEIVVCTAPPLEYKKKSVDVDQCSESSSVSEAGTYTLDGDNYTEEQKAKMNIDKLSKMHVQKQNVEVIDLEAMAELDFKKPLPPKKHTSYLERIKSKVKTISDRTFHKNRLSNEISSLHLPSSQSQKSLDIGNFTSITSSGVFNKSQIQQTLGTSKSKQRKHSLTKSQIDSSEYIQKFGESSFTDSEKATHQQQNDNYQLNIFTASLSTPPIETIAANNDERHSIGIERAETKNDWIQEWAKNARKNTQQTRIRELKTNERITKNGNFFNQHQQNNHSQDEEQFGDYLDRNYSTNRKRYECSNNYDVNHDRQRDAYNNNNNQSQRALCISDFDDPDDCASMLSTLKSTYLEQHSGFESSSRSRKEYFNNSRPPISPTKIPSPMHSMTRPRSSSINRSCHGSTTDIDKHDTEMYLHETAAAISTLQNIHRNNNSSQQHLTSPSKLSANFTSSPSIRRLTNKDSSVLKSAHNIALHKRNLSLDGTEYKPKLHLNKENMFHSYNSDKLNDLLKIKQHTRHNSYEGHLRPLSMTGSIDQITKLPHKSLLQQQQKQQPLNISSPTSTSSSSSSTKQQLPYKQLQQYRHDNNRPKSTPTQIKRSSSFSTKPFVRSTASPTVSKTHTPKIQTKALSKPALQKSASSASFKGISSSSVKYENEIYLNDNDDLYADATYSSESEISDVGTDTTTEKEIITNTRYNKAFLIRLEQNKQKASGGGGGGGAGGNSTTLKQGVSACPNTPELPRRGDYRTARASLRDRASMPRDSSINRMKQDIPNINLTKKVLGGTVPGSVIASNSKDKDKKVLPKYLDISKYKPSQGNTFLKRDESKSTLINKEIKRSSSALGALNKSDVGRSSVRSVKSAANGTKSTLVTSKCRFCFLLKILLHFNIF